MGDASANHSLAAPLMTLYSAANDWSTTSKELLSKPAACSEYFVDSV